MYPGEDVTDRDERFLAAEFIREKIFRLLGDEVPYATTVAIDQFERRRRAAADPRDGVRGQGGPARHPARRRRRALKAIATQARARHGAPLRRQGVPRGVGAREARMGATTRWSSRLGYCSRRNLRADMADARATAAGAATRRRAGVRAAYLSVPRDEPHRRGLHGRLRTRRDGRARRQAAALGNARAAAGVPAAGLVVVRAAANSRRCTRPSGAAGCRCSAVPRCCAASTSTNCC